MLRLSSRVVYITASLGIMCLILLTARASHREFISAKLAEHRLTGAKPPQVTKPPTIASDFGPERQYKRRENATFVTLARNSDLKNLLPAIMSFEDRFNHRYNYDWVFLNNEDFSDEFVQTVSSLVSGKSKFGKIPKEHWGYPDWINQTKAAEKRRELEKQKVIYGGSESYRHMCRFESGFFFHHELMQEYRYYWRVEPETKMHCDVDYDVFKFMRENNKTYGWTISMKEFAKTVPTLWSTFHDFLNKNPDTVHPNALTKFVQDDKDPNKYNLCHFWTNFEIADADFWRSDKYQRLFEHLDKAGGFFYERWGDAPVHSLAIAYMEDRDRLHFFDDISYYHHPFTRCPAFHLSRNLRCSCLQSNSFDWRGNSCLRNYYRAQGWQYPEDYKKP